MVLMKAVIKCVGQENSRLTRKLVKQTQMMKRQKSESSLCDRCRRYFVIYLTFTLPFKIIIRYECDELRHRVSGGNTK